MFIADTDRPYIGRSEGGHPPHDPVGQEAAWDFDPARAVPVLEQRSQRIQPVSVVAHRPAIACGGSRNCLQDLVIMRVRGTLSMPGGTAFEQLVGVRGRDGSRY